MAELLKMRFNQGLEAQLFYWKDKHNKEIDAIIDTGAGPIALEIKSALTFSSSFFDNLRYWGKLSDNHQKSAVIYGGDKSFTTTDGKVVRWNGMGDL